MSTVTAGAVDSFEAGVAALGVIDGGRADRTAAVRFFVSASEADPQMCDAWLGRILCGDNDSRIFYHAWKSRDQMQAQIRRLGVKPGLFLPKFDIGMDIVAIDQTIYDRSVLGIALARMQAMADPPDYAEAADLLAAAPDSALTRWVKAATFYRAQRWPDVIEILEDDSEVFGADRLIKAAVDVALGASHAFLGEFDAAERYLRSADAQEDLPDGRSTARWFLAMIARERGEADAAVTLLRTINSTAPSPEVAEAIENPGIRLSVTSREAVAARSDPWDPRSGPDAAELAANRAAEKRAVLFAEATRELDEQIGMDALKEQVKTFRARVRMAEKRRELGLKTPAAANHMVFVGPPGTGKTTLARIVAKVVCGLGIVSTSKVVQVSAKDLVGEYLGHSERATRDAVNRALDGVLFIDEAYALVESEAKSESNADQFGKAVVNTLLTFIENERERLVVIIAGYERDIDRLLEANEGLRSRFAHRFRFETYTAAELVAIADVLAAGRDDALDEQALEVFGATCERLAEQQVRGRNAIDAVANGRFVRKVLEAAADLRDLRIDEAPPEVFSAEALTTIRRVDMAAALRKVLAAESKSADADTDLSVLVGER